MGSLVIDEALGESLRQRLKRITTRKPRKPTTRTRIDLGLALKDTKVPKRLIDTGGLAKKDRITHRIEIASLKDIDAEVKKWLKTAYEMDK